MTKKTEKAQNIVEASLTMESALKAISTGYWCIDTGHELFRVKTGQIVTDALEHCSAAMVGVEELVAVRRSDLLTIVRYLDINAGTHEDFLEALDRCRAAFSLHEIAYGNGAAK